MRFCRVDGRIVIEVSGPHTADPCVMDALGVTGAWYQAVPLGWHRGANPGIAATPEEAIAACKERFGLGGDDCKIVFV